MILKVQLTEKQSLFDRTVEKTPVTLYGGAKGGGKSKGLRLIMLKRRFQYPGSSGVIFRESFPELEKNHIRPLFQDFPDLHRFYNYGTKVLSIPNGSTLEFAFCAKESHLRKHQGVEYNDLAIEEAGNWKERWFTTLRGSNRSSKPGIPARMLLTANPGGIGHMWLKRLFVTREYYPNERAKDFAFIPALVTDNPFLMLNDPDYVRRLDAEQDEMLRRAYRYGDWDIAAGQFFSMFRRQFHVLPANFRIQPYWTRLNGYDYGFGHPAAWISMAVDEDGAIYVYKEYVKASQLISQQAEAINPSGKKVVLSAEAGHDCWAQRGQRGPTIAEEFQEQGILLHRANIARVQRASQLRSRLAFKLDADGKIIAPPRIYFLESCPITIHCITELVHDPANREDVLKVDSENGDPMAGDDPYDALGHGIMSRPITPRKPPEEKRDRYSLKKEKRFDRGEIY